MNSQTSVPVSSLDETLVAILSEQLGCDVCLRDSDDREHDAVIDEAIGHAGKAAVGDHDRDASQRLVALSLPGGGVATWAIDAAFARQSAALGEHVLALQTALNERNQLQAEADALATQVVNDFEELSLIRSLANSLELPTCGAGANDVAMNSLRPLADGVGAESIAAVFLCDETGEMGPPCWSGKAIASANTLHQLICEHRQEAEAQPVVRNRNNEFAQSFDAEALNEFVLVQCRTEGRLHGWLVACNRLSDAGEDVPWAQLGFTTVQASLMETATNQLAAQLHNTRLLRQKEELFTDMVRALVNAVEARDPYTCGHSERVALFASSLGKAIGESPAGCERIYLSGLLHDVGKIAIPDGVLQKPGHLDEEERAIIETHPEAGWRILHELDALREVLPGVLYHHEQFDGGGYPDGLVGENIPQDGRILAVCDAFDAMTSSRPYRKGMPTDRAIEILRGGSGEYWDPTLVQALMDNMDEFERIRNEHQPRQQAERKPAEEGQPSLDAVHTNA